MTERAVVQYISSLVTSGLGLPLKLHVQHHPELQDLDGEDTQAITTATTPGRMLPEIALELRKYIQDRYHPNR